MSLPVINPTTNFPAWHRGEYFAMLLAATNGPVTWGAIVQDSSGTALALASIGLTLNATTGLLQGAFKEAGNYNVLFTATNSTGSSTLPVTVGIEALSFDLDASVAIFVDVETGQVTARGATAILWGKHGGRKAVDIGFVKRGFLLDDLVMGTIHLGLKELEPERLLDLTSGQYKVSNGIYRIELDLDNKKLFSVLGDYEDDKQTIFNAIAEIRYGYYMTMLDDQPDKLMPDRSRNFVFQIERDLIPN